MAKTAIEEKLLSKNTESVGKELFSAQDEEVFFDEEGTAHKPAEETRVLTGDDAMKFLGLPENRPHQQLRQGDFARITARFNPLIIKYIRQGDDVKKLFWKNIRIRVWHVDNVDQKTADNKPYSGLVYYGDVIETFIPQEKKSTAHEQYKVQLIDVKVTEDMQNAVR